MSKIRVLDAEVVKRIAAGEVSLERDKYKNDIVFLFRHCKDR